MNVCKVGTLSVCTGGQVERGGQHAGLMGERTPLRLAHEPGNVANAQLLLTAGAAGLGGVGHLRFERARRVMYESDAA